MDSRRAIRTCDLRTTPSRQTRHRAINLIRYVRRVEAGHKLHEPATVKLIVLPSEEILRAGRSARC